MEAAMVSGGRERERERQLLLKVTEPEQRAEEKLVSGSKLWQTERSCMCCQESGEREAAITLNCPKPRPGEPKEKKVLTRAPIDCMCRPCTDVEEGTVLAQEIANFIQDSPMDSVPFLK